MKHKRLIAGAGLLGLVILIAGWTLYGRNGHFNTEILLLGNIDVRQVDLAFKAPGRLAAVNFEEGDAVKAGDIVASLEKPDFEDERALAAANVAAQSNLVKKLESGARPEEIEQARAAVASRQAALTLAQSTLTRMERLAETDAASHQLHEEAQAKRDEAAAALRTAEEGLTIAETGGRVEDIEAARAALSASEATHRLAERRLADADLKAPSDGIILTRVREPGAIVNAGETIYTLSLNSPIWVRTYVSDPDLGRIRPGMTAEVRTDSGGVYKGQVGFISPVAEFTPKTVETRELRTALVYRLRIIVDNPDGGLRQGMPVTVTLEAAHSS